MALPNELIVNNTTGSSVDITDLGIPVAGSSSITLTNYATMQELRDSKSLFDLIDLGTLRIRVGGVNLSVANSKRFFLEPIDSGGRTGVVAASASNETLSGTATIDSVSVVAGDRVLLTAQTTSSENGVWIVQAGSWVRPYDFNTGDAAAATAVVVNKGTTNGDAIWVCSSDSGSDIIGTNDLFFSKQEGSASGIDHAPTYLAKRIWNRGPFSSDRFLALGDITVV